MKRDALEKITSSLVVTFITVFAGGIILILANLFFSWDLFRPETEKILYFLGAAMFVVITAAAVINIMLNLSRLAFFAEKITNKMLEE